MALLFVLRPNPRSPRKHHPPGHTRDGASLIHPYNNYFIIAGQGTAALELLTNQPSLDIVIAPVGGGGLMSGTALAAKSLNKNIQVYGAEPKGADDAWQSLQAGKIMPQQNPNTIADGLLTSLGDLTFAILSKNLNGIFTVSEKGIVEAMKMIWQYMKIIVEPSSAVTLAAVLEYPMCSEIKNRNHCFGWQCRF